MAANTDPVFAYFATDGRFVIAGRYREPTEDEIADAAARIAAQGLRAWLVRMVGNRYAKKPPSVIRLRALHEGLDDAAFGKALEAFVIAHRETMAQLPG